MKRWAWIAGVLLLAGTAAAAPAEEELEGYAEWREGQVLVVDGQRVRLASGARFDGEGEARTFEAIPLGYEVKARGARGTDGVLLARHVEARPNGQAMFEKKVREVTDQAEADYRRQGRFFQRANGRVRVVGKLLESGPDVVRVREIMDRLRPPYLSPDDVRVYVIDNKEWNAFAMGNYSVFVFTGLLHEMDDDEVAIVLGHELAHATHEHTRRQFKKAMWIQLAALGVGAATDTIDSRKQRALANLVLTFAGLAWKNGYGRDLEDQADRCGLRYAYEAGYDVRRGPALWQRFAKKYGERSPAVNFFFADHSRASVRATNLQRELALNYATGPKTGVAAAPRRRPVAVAAPAAPEDKRTSLIESQGRSSSEIRRGMRTWEVRRRLGRPEREVTAGGRRRWTYPDCTVIFEDGKVVEVRF